MPRSPALAPPPGNVHFPLADSVRGIGVLCVILCHSAGYSSAFETASWGWVPFYLGFAAVAVFFALSGFLLYRPFASAHAGLRRAPSVRSYGRRRVLRIVPAYWVALTLLAIYPHITGVFTSDWWIYYGFGQVYSLNSLAHGISVAWSVCTEVTFYLLLPVIALAVARLVNRVGPLSWWRAELAVLVPFAAIGIAGRALVQERMLPLWNGNTLVSYTSWFAVGMALAVLSVAVERRGGLPARLETAACRSWIWWGSAVAALALAYGAFDIWHVDRLRHPPHVPPGNVVALQILFTLAAGAILVPVVFGSGGAIRRLLSTRALGFVGLVSYGMYLWHHPLEAWLTNTRGPGMPTATGPGIQHWFGGHQLTLTYFVITVALSMAIGTASYYVVELPFLRLKERRRARPRVVAEPAVAAAGEAERS